MSVVNFNELVGLFSAFRMLGTSSIISTDMQLTREGVMLIIKDEQFLQAGAGNKSTMKALEAVLYLVLGEDNEVEEILFKNINSSLQKAIEEKVDIGSRIDYDVLSILTQRSGVRE